VIADFKAAIAATGRLSDVIDRAQTQRDAAELAALQHVTEAGFAAPSGTLVLAGLTDVTETAARLTVPAGPIGVLATFAGLDTLDESALDGDHYALHLWPGTVEGVRVLRHYCRG
jgi:hypothetical protein